MNCQDCGSHDAFVHLTEIVDGEVHSLWLCTRCSRRRQESGRPPSTSSRGKSDDSDHLAAFLGDHQDQAEVWNDEEARTCPSCDFKLDDWRHTSLLGCPRCYQAFRATLQPHLARYHGHASHFGKIPNNRLEDPNQLVTIQKMRSALDKAVAKEDFEEAAHLRDLIRMLKSGKDESEEASP